MGPRAVLDAVVRRRSLSSCRESNPVFANVNMDIFSARAGFLLFANAPGPLLEPTQSPVKWILGIHSSGLNRLGREDYRSPTYIVEVEKAWSYTSPPPYVFLVSCLIKHRDSCSFLCLYEFISTASLSKSRVSLGSCNSLITVERQSALQHPRKVYEFFRTHTSSSSRS
jgi:hypothetical protein